MKTLKTNILNIHITNMENCHRVFPPYTDDNNEFINKSDAQIAQDNIPLRDFLEKSYGETFISNASKLFKSRLDKELNQRIFETTLNKYLIEFRFNCYMEDTLSIYEDDWSPERRKALYRNILQKTCSDIYLDHYRTELSGWINHIEKGKALFIDCLMGVGKTYSIVKTLATNPNISAIVFFPTNKLCRDVVEKLKREIVTNNPELRNKYKDVPIASETEYDECEFTGCEFYHYSREYLGFEVYYADGINPRECPKFDEIIGQYQQNWINKISICLKCEKFKSCRFFHHSKKALQARVIITTHHQYDKFYRDKKFHSWTVYGKKKPRDLFIVDEDLVFSQLYQPINLDYPELRAFIGTITDFLQEYDEISDMREQINILWSHINNCDKTSIIRAIDPDFTFPERFVKVWEKSLPEQPFIIPEYIEWSGIVGNHLKVIEHAVRFGAVVEKWGNRFKIHLPNPRSCDLSKAPPHVFFDGTMLDEKFLGKKLSGVKFNKVRIDINHPWEINVYQNVNSDLPIKWIERDKQNIQEYLKYVINNLPNEKKVFILTTKAITEAFLKAFITSEFKDRNIVSGYYGNIRGINAAKECDVGIMLGSFMPSDSIEIAMALEFLNSEDLEKDIKVAENYLWTWNETNGVRTYKEKFAIIGEMAKAFRHSEHRQALARTRYLFHDVDFYIISKDRVSDYDPFLPEPEDEQFRADLFQPRPKRPEAIKKYEKIKEEVFEWFQAHDTVTATEIHNFNGIRRQTVGDKLKEMCENGLLELVPGKKKIYRLSKK